MKTTVIGLGLIGGCIALDLKEKGVATHVVGVDSNEEHAQQALALGLVDEIKWMEEAVKTSQLVIVAIPVSALSTLLPLVLDKIGPNTVVIDTGSTKARVVQAVSGHLKRDQYVAAHPIAGTENSGPRAAFRGLFKNKTMIVCDREHSSAYALDVAGRVFEGLGVQVIDMNPVEHDKHVAYVSHLSHVSSFLLGQTVLDIEKDEKNIFALAGSGFASTVRLAKSSPEMWAPIFEQNLEYLSQALLEYIMHLQRFHYYLMKKDTKEVHRIMSQANEIRRVLDGIELKERNNKAKTTIIEK